MSTFIRWWAIFCTIVAGAGLAGFFGLFNTLWFDDLSKLSFINLGFFSGIATFIGVLTYRIHVKENLRLTKLLPFCWWAAEAMMAMGMMGTLLGFIMMFTSNVQHIDFSNVETAKQILGQLTRGTTTAVVTTFVGLLLSQLTKLQLVNLEQDLEEVFRE